MLSEIIKSKREEILDIANRYGAYNVRIFGSVARGEENSRSDIDVIIELEQGRSLIDHAGLILELEKLLGVQVDVITERGLKQKIRERVLSEAIPV